MGSPINDVNFGGFSAPPPSARFLVIRLLYYRHKILDPLSMAVTSFMDDPCNSVTQSLLQINGRLLHLWLKFYLFYQLLLL